MSVSILLWCSFLCLLLCALCREAAAQASALNFTNTTALGYDPVHLMCARWEHQSVLKGNALYIDGGLETTYDGDERWTDEFFLGLNYYLLAIDMSASWNWGKNLTTTIHNKSASTPLQPPTVLRGHLFQGLPSDPHIYLYGGADFASNTSAHTPPSGSALWSYDTSSPNNTDWQRTDISDAVPRSPTRGARAEAPDLGLAFYLNGETGSVPSIAVWGNLSTQAAHVDGMVVLDTANATGRSAWNVSTAAMTQGQPRAGAGMTFVPAMGEKGALVLVGGMARAAAVVDDPGSGELIDLSQIQIFDLASWLNNPSDDNAGTWYAQPASGDVPALRTDFCLVAASAPDGSSHNVYLYGGRNPKSGTIYDDLYALSLPSFTWIKLFEGQSPRWGHTCHLVPNSTQLVTVGGALDTNRTTCDWEWAGVAVLDAWTVDWNNAFDVGARPYKVTQGIAEVVGGGDAGGATKTAPVGGWATEALEGLFARGAVGASAAAAAGDSGKTDTAAIVGGVVGGVAGLGGMGGMFMWWLMMTRRRRKEEMAAELGYEEAERYEAEGTIPEYRLEGPKRVDSELQGDTPALEVDGEDHFERIIELSGGLGHERFELPGSGVGVKECEAWEERRKQKDADDGEDGDGGVGERGDV